MQKTNSVARAVCLAIVCVCTACSGSSTTSVPTTPTTTTTVTPSIVLSAPTAASPPDGATSNGWPTLTITDSTHSGPAGPLVYRFDVATDTAFTNIMVTSTVSETTGQTSYTPTSSQTPADQTTLYWRAVAIDPINVVASQPSAPASFKYLNSPSPAQVIATQEGSVLWPGTQPTGTPGHAQFGHSWNVAVVVSFDGVTFLSPRIPVLQMYDLLDRGFTPQAAINWLNGNGYPTPAVYYPDVASIGFSFEYLALVNGRWDLVIRSGA